MISGKIAPTDHKGTMGSHLQASLRRLQDISIRVSSKTPDICVAGKQPSVSSVSPRFFLISVGARPRGRGGRRAANAIVREQRTVNLYPSLTRLDGSKESSISLATFMPFSVPASKPQAMNCAVTELRTTNSKPGTKSGRAARD